MISRINRTGRKDIQKRHIKLALRRGEKPIFDLSLQLASYGFPPDARVRVEAGRSNAVQRWDFGAVGQITPPSDEERRMTDVPEAATFRVFVVAADGSGKLFGHVRSTRPLRPIGSLLGLTPRDLGDEVWRVEFDENGGAPELLVNSRIDGISEIARSDPAFRSLVMPEAFRTILTRMVLIERGDPDDGEGPWADWFGLARDYLPDGGEPPSLAPGPVDIAELDRAREWIDEVVHAFAEKPLDAADQYRAAVSEGGRA